MKEHRYVLGLVDYHNRGRATCEAAITWTLENGRFSMCAEIWRADKRDIHEGGQCVDRVAAYFPKDMKAQRMVEIWKRWHLNDMRAGSAIQEQWLRNNPIPAEEYAYPKSHYDVASEKLAAAGLNPDPDGYRYGHAWKCEELPAEVIAEIQSWSQSNA